MLDEKQYERIARSLDGEDVELIGAERQAADEIRRAEAELSAAMDASATPARLRRARRRMIAALEHPRLRLRRIGTVAAVAAAAAAVLVLILWQPGAAPSPQPPVRVQAAPSFDSVLAALEETAREDEFDLIQYELDDLAAGAPSGAAWPALELRIEAIENDLWDFNLDDFPTYPIEG